MHPQQVWLWHWAVWCGWCFREGMDPEGAGQAGEVGLCKPHEWLPARGLRPAQAQTQPGWRMAWVQPWGEGLGAVCGWAAQCDLAMCAHSTEIQTCPGLHPNNVKGGDCPSPLCSGETLPGALHPAPGPQPEKDIGLLEWAHRKLQRCSECWSSSALNTGWESWTCSAWRKEGSRDISLQPSSA